MPSPFPGVDPFIENQEWEDFHTTWNTVVRECMLPGIEPRYFVRVERRVYVEHPGDTDARLRRADVAVVAADPAEPFASSQVGSTATAVAPVACELPMPEQRRETYLVIRLAETREIVTVLETLSPSNKRPGGDGRAEYLKKREEVLESQAHLIEIDLLRGGAQMPIVGPVPAGEFSVVISRAGRRPRADVYPWSLRDALPPIPVPLLKGDPDANLNLQEVFNTVYDRARYDLSLNYDAPLTPPFEESDASWAAELLAAK